MDGTGRAFHPVMSSSSQAMPLVVTELESPAERPVTLTLAPEPAADSFIAALLEHSSQLPGGRGSARKLDVSGRLRIRSGGGARTKRRSGP
jgi:hypothetical protein